MILRWLGALALRFMEIYWHAHDCLAPKCAVCNECIICNLRPCRGGGPHPGVLP